MRPIALLLASAAIIAYASNFLLHVEGDAAPNILTAASWVAQGNADLDEFVGRVPFDVQYVGGHAYPYTPPGVAVLTVIPVGLAIAAGADVASLEFVALFGKVAGVAAAGLSVAFVFLACALVARPRAALLATVGYAFGTTVWSISAQQIWMHGPAQLFVALGAYLLLRGRGSTRAGFALGFAALIRPVEAFVAALGILRARRGGYALRYVLWGFPAAAFLATYYVLAFGGPRQSYAGLTWSLPPPGWLGLLVSPSRGLFVYSPFLVFGVAGFAMAWRARDESARTVRDLSLATFAIYATYALFDGWFGGWAYGPRYLGDALPLLTLGAAFAFDRGALRTIASRVALAATLAWSVAINFAGAGWYYFFWNGYHWDVTPSIDLTSYRVWDWSDPQWWFVVRRMFEDPGWTLVPAVVGALAAAFLVWRAYARLGLRPAAEHEAGLGLAEGGYLDPATSLNAHR